MLTDLMERAEGVTLVGGDFNFVFDQNIDTTAPRLSQATKYMTKFRATLDKYQLVDIWRFFHPVDRDYTFHSKVHNTYHILDLFFYKSNGDGVFLGDWKLCVV